MPLYVYFPSLEKDSEVLDKTQDSNKNLD